MPISSLQKLAYQLYSQSEDQARSAEMHADMRNTITWCKRLNITMAQTIRLCACPLSLTRFKQMKHKRKGTNHAGA